MLVVVKKENLLKMEISSCFTFKREVDKYVNMEMSLEILARLMTKLQKNVEQLKSMSWKKSRDGTVFQRFQTRFV